MKEKFIKNRNKILIVLALILSLSGVVVLAEVSSNGTASTPAEQGAQILEASLLSKKVNEDETVAYDLTSITTEEVNDQPSINVEEDTEEVIDQEDTEVLKVEIVAYEEAVLEEKQTRIEESYQLELASIDTKTTSLKYDDISFGKIGTLSSEDVHIGISTANDFVNIRDSASEEGKILGKLYANEAAAILGVENQWILVESGSVKGYVTSDYLNTDLTKDQIIESKGNLRATITVDGLNVRQEANEEAQVLTVVYENEKYTVTEVTGNWVKVSITKDDIVGFVSREYADLSVSFEQAISIEEEQEIIRKQKEEAERKAAEAAAKKKAAEEEAARKAAAKKKSQQKAAAKKSSSTSKASSSNSASNKISHGASEHAAKEEIARRESGGNYNARNGKYIGRYQLNKSYLGGDHSPENQERVVENYVAKRYGSWQQALKFWNANGWY